ncbi:hypothetical protein BVRB_7g166300 [Beta vulgaris subsp. vulgaris]|nr:hypothetical protein BVRB_7g166300 [Beta vulgaris subsp. vulgaris]
MMCPAGVVLPASADPEPEGSISIAKRLKKLKIFTRRSSLEGSDGDTG